jgi:hypothetical protein
MQTPCPFAVFAWLCAQHFSLAASEKPKSSFAPFRCRYRCTVHVPLEYRAPQATRFVATLPSLFVYRYSMGGLLTVALLCNAAIRPVDPKHYMIVAVDAAAAAVASPTAGSKTA